MPRGASSACVPVVSPCQPTPPQVTLHNLQVVLDPSPVGSLLLSFGYWCVLNFVCALQD